MKKLDSWIILSEKDEINNRFLRIKNVTFRLPNNQILPDYFIAEKNPIAVVVPVKNGRAYLLKEWERGVGEVGHKFPSGRVEQEETPAVGAKRELREEIGLIAHELTYLGNGYVDPGFMTTIAHYFLCQEFDIDDKQKEEDPFELFEGEWVDLSTIEQMIYKNEIKNPFVIVAFFLALHQLS